MRWGGLLTATWTVVLTQPQIYLWSLLETLKNSVGACACECVPIGPQKPKEFLKEFLKELEDLLKHCENERKCRAGGAGNMSRSWNKLRRCPQQLDSSSMPTLTISTVSFHGFGAHQLLSIICTGTFTWTFFLAERLSKPYTQVFFHEPSFKETFTFWVWVKESFSNQSFVKPWQ